MEEPKGPLSLEDDKWRLLPSFFRSFGLVKQHVDSYDHFVAHKLNKIVQANKRVTCDADSGFFLEFRHVWVGKPTVEEDLVQRPVTPFECRLRDLTYSAPIFAQIVYTQNKIAQTKHSVCIGRLPVMLRSRACCLHGKAPDDMARLRECPLDPGGYFVVRGAEKVILMQEQMSMNRIIVDKDQKGCHMATVVSSTDERMSSRSSLVLRDNKFYLRHNTFIEDIPLFVVLKGMGITSDQEIVSLVGSDPIYADALAASLEEITRLGIHSTMQALIFLHSKFRPRMGQKRRSNLDQARECLISVIFNHIETRTIVDGTFTVDFRPKVVYICTMLRRLVRASLGKLARDDKDYYGNKRLELAGDLLGMLFEDLFHRLCVDLSKAANAALSKANRAQQFDPSQSLRPDIVTQGFIHAISSGNWVIKRLKTDRAGITDTVLRLSYISALGMMTRITSSFAKGMKVAGPRSLQASQWGMLCPADTPEGESCGLVKNLALLCAVSTYSDKTPVIKLCYSLGTEDISTLSGDDIAMNYTVFVNGDIVGVHCHPQQLLRAVRLARRKGHLDRHTSAFVNEQHRCVYIATDQGRTCRPLIICENGASRLTLKMLDDVVAGYKSWDDLMANGVVEYLDVNEENGALVAMRSHQVGPKTTHLEIDPLTALGCCAGLIPYPHHNQSPRNTYQCAMGKQAIGAIAYNQYERFDTQLNLLVYPQKPLMHTKTISLMAYNEVPAGQNSSVAVMSFSGYDIEDAIVMNKASVDRGYGRCIVYKKSSAPMRTQLNGSQDRLSGPPKPEPGQTSLPPNQRQYQTVEADGLPKVGATVQTDDVLINRQVPSASASAYSPSPICWKASVPGTVDKVLLTSNDKGELLVKVNTRMLRIPELGDKFSSRHGQKGVVGLIVKQSDMPFSQNGVCPDLIMNPHGFPSRMTVGKMLECVGGKAGAFAGRQGDATVFGGDTHTAIGETLVKAGFNYTGKDLLYSGITGEPTRAYIFFGPIYYQRLKHMVQDKLHSRARGPRATLTRQPTEGRSNKGGLRMGEMERDCLLAYGTACLMQERLMLSSDVFIAQVCEGCGMLASRNWCQTCKTSKGVMPIRLPYAAKLMLQELQSMNVLARIQLRNVT
ncbi:DNA-directed RNA polymerase, subunit 2 [Kipferlia bialata]|uniref:DNA-directed RNA polymerase subunit beta n=1 Tax=Kipferlia bialata TaxID=797122 RepID=A0A9K3GIA3_9EUKA|nr:DNA-directed RNA polymerase, subunit 2 [Kipferlia bialata]|eukprot:g4480.t1